MWMRTSAFNEIRYKLYSLDISRGAATRWTLSKKAHRIENAELWEIFIDILIRWFLEVSKILFEDESK